jgi:hypothetical protein
MKFIQCKLKQGTANQQAWIEERGAKQGASVEVPELGGFWEVIHVFGEVVLTKDKLREQQKLNRNSLPSIA